MFKEEFNDGEQRFLGSVVKVVDCFVVLVGGGGVFCVIGNDLIVVFVVDVEFFLVFCVQIEIIDVQSLLNINKNRLFYQV